MIINVYPYWISFAFYLSIIVAFCFFLFVIEINYTPSIPQGIYFNWFYNPNRHNLVQIKFVPFIKINNTYYSGLYKKIAGRAGDEICIFDTRLFVNNIVIDTHYARYLPSQCIKLSSNELFLYTEHPRSIDSRLLGVFSAKNITSLIPVLLFPY